MKENHADSFLLSLSKTKMCLSCCRHSHLDTFWKLTVTPKILWISKKMLVSAPWKRPIIWTPQKTHSVRLHAVRVTTFRRNRAERGRCFCTIIWFFTYAEQSSKAISDTLILNNPINNTHYLDDLFAK